MASLDIETAGPMLKRIKIGQLDPELLTSVMELAEEHGYEVTITASSDLHFLFRIYQAERVKQKRNLKRLKKAENLILRLAGLSLHHDAERAQERSRREEKRPPFGHATMEEDMRLSARLRELFSSIGITDEKEIRETVMFLGEAKAEERVRAAAASPIGPELVKALFAEQPEALRTPKDADYDYQIKAMDHKKGLIDAWAEESGETVPVWADYSRSPGALLVDYAELSKGLGLSGAGEKTLGAAIASLGFTLAEKGGALVLEGADGYSSTISDPKTGEWAPTAFRRLLRRARALNERVSGQSTVPDVPSAMTKAAKKTEVEDTALTQLEGLSPAAARAYRSKGGGGEGMIAALHELGMDVSKLVGARESMSTESGSRTPSREQRRFDSSVRMLFELMVGKDLEGIVRRNFNAEGLKLGRVGYLIGASGAFELQLLDGSGSLKKRLYLSLQDMGPARIGKELAEASGMVSHGILCGDTSGDFVLPDGRAFALTEDAREVGARQRVRIRTTGRFAIEDVRPRGAAMFKEDLTLRPDPSDQLHREFYNALADAEGRKGLVRALLGYFEMSRRTLLPDRRPANTFVLLSEGREGSGFTFQPTDMDGIGNFIESSEGRADFSDFNRDFHYAAADFAVSFHEGMTRAAAAGMISARSIPSAALILAEMAAAAQAPLPPDSSDMVAFRGRILRENDGKMIGIGFDAAERVGHTIPSQGGRVPIEREDGRVVLSAPLASRTMDAAARPEAATDYRSGFMAGGMALLEKLPDKIGEIAVAMVETAQSPDDSEEGRVAKAARLLRLGRRSGGSIAARVASDPEVASASGGQRARLAAMKAEEIIFGARSVAARAAPEPEPAELQ